jgi:hypothetical protein
MSHFVHRFYYIRPMRSKSCADVLGEAHWHGKMENPVENLHGWSKAMHWSKKMQTTSTRLWQAGG